MEVIYKEKQLKISLKELRAVCEYRHINKNGKAPELRERILKNQRQSNPCLILSHKQDNTYFSLLPIELRDMVEDYRKKNCKNKKIMTDIISYFSSRNHTQNNKVDCNLYKYFRDHSLAFAARKTIWRFNDFPVINDNLFIIFINILLDNGYCFIPRTNELLKYHKSQYRIGYHQNKYYLYLI